MSEPIIRVEHLSKQYRLGSIGYQTFNAAFAGKLARLLGKEDPNAQLDGSGKLDGVNEQFWALDDVSFSLMQGEALGVIGSNGAGKSTLLKLLTGITTPTKGRFTIDGRIASLLEVGTGFHPEMTGRENVYMNGAILGMSKQEIDRKFDEIVDFSEVGQFIDTPVKRYSSGMYVRLAFAIASHLNTEIVIVDEVLAVGDAEFQKKCLRQMDYASRGEGHTVLFVSHNLTAIKNLCTKCLLLEKGKAIAFGPTEEITNLYLKRTMANLGGCAVAWEDEKRAPRNKHYLLKGITLADSAGRPMELITCDDAFQMIIDYLVFAPVARVCFGLNVYARGGELVFRSWSNLVEGYDAVRPAGSYRAACAIPAHFLNRGEYSISLQLCADSYEDDVFARDLLNFSVENGTAFKGDYPWDVPGFVHPVLPWTNERA